MRRYPIPQTVVAPRQARRVSNNQSLHIIQHASVGPTSPWGLPIGHVLLPQMLQRLDYKTHLVGSWHLGHANDELMPIARGFDSFYGSFTSIDPTSLISTEWGSCSSTTCYKDFWRTQTTGQTYDPVTTLPGGSAEKALLLRSQQVRQKIVRNRGRCPSSYTRVHAYV